MNMFLALAWLLLGITVLTWQQLTGDTSWSIPVGGYRVSYGWFMFLLVVYNLARWRSVRQLRQRNRLVQQENAERSRTRRRSAQDEQPNPDLNLTEGPTTTRTDITDGPRV
jgi:heme exporter protein D